MLLILDATEEGRPEGIQELEKYHMLLSIAGKVMNRIILERLKVEVDIRL